MRAVLVDPFDLEVEVGDLKVTGGTLSWSYESETKAGGSIDVIDASIIGNNLVRVYDGDRALGTYFASVPSITHGNGAKAATVELYSTLKRLQDDAIAWDMTYSAGTVATEAIATGADSVLAYAMEPYVINGETEAQIAAAIPSDISLDCGTSRLTQANSVLTAAGHAGLDVNPYGQAVITWYVSPSERGASFELDGTDVTKDITTERDNSCPSKVYFVADSGGSLAVGSAELDSTSPFHWSQVGRRVTQVYRANGEETQASLSSMAARSLAQSASDAEKATISHMLGSFKIGDVGRVAAGPLSGTWKVLTMDLDLQTKVCATRLGRVSYE